MGINKVSFPPRLQQDQRSVGWGLLSPLRPVYPAQKLIFAQCSRNAGDDGASEEKFSWSRVATGQKRATCLSFYTLSVPPRSP